MKIKVDAYSAKSINEAIAQLEKYAKSVERKTKELEQRVAKELTELIQAGFNESVYDVPVEGSGKKPTVRVENVSQDGATLVIAYGREAIFVEFGAGVHYNGAGNYPGERPEGVVGIGEYGYGLGRFNSWRFQDEDGNVYETYGTPASMPMFNSVQDVVSRFVKIAKEVFREGTT